MCCLSTTALVSAWLEPYLCHLSIEVKELIPVVLAAALFGHQWVGKVVQFVVDNKAVMDVLNATFICTHDAPYLTTGLFCSKI